MKLKQISFLIVPAFVVASAISSLLVPADSTLALTTQEKKACYEQWAGAYTGTAGDGKKLTTKQWNNFNDTSKCNKKRGGSCKSTSYSEGASISCERKDGQYDGGDAGWAGTTGGTDGDTNLGDDGTYTPITGSNVQGDDCGGVQTAIIKCDADNSGDLENNGVWALLIIALNVLTAGVGIIAIGGIVYGAILYTTAEDKADQVKKAIDIITNVVIGLIAFALMWAGLNFIVPGGVFA